MVYTYYGDCLYHHGILGQKWGVRRFQNKDGTYTEAGKERRSYKDAKENYKNKVSKAKSKFIEDSSNILTKKEKNKRDAILNKSESFRTSKEEELLAEYRNRVKTETIKNWVKRNETIKKAKEEFKNSEEYKMHKAKIIGAAIIGTGLAVYGGYKISKYLSDQKNIMELRDQKDTINRLIPQLEANADYIQRGKMSLNFFNGSSENANERAVKAYLESAKNYKENAEKIDSAIKSISKKHIYNFGMKVTKHQYNRKVSELNALAKAGTSLAAKTIKKVGSVTFDVTKGILEVLLNSSIY